MEELDESYRKFKEFLDDFLLRRAKGDLTADDFEDSKFEYICSQLEEILSILTLSEAMRVQVYFNDLLLFNLTGEIDEPVQPSPLSPLPRFEESDVPPSSPENPTPAGESFASYFPSVQEQTLCEPSSSIYQNRRTAPIAGSTPLSAIGPTIETSVQLEQPGQGDEFIADIISQLNLSPIPQAAAPPPSPDTNIETRSHFKTNEHQFLRNLSNAMKKVERSRVEVEASATPRRTIYQPPIAQTRGLPVKEKQKRTDFEVLCCAAPKRKTEEQLRRAEEFFLHFPLAPGKTRNLITRVTNNVFIPQGKSGHIPAERCVNLSNILRAHASQRQSSIEQPAQISLLRSPCTSLSQGFTPVRAAVIPSQSRQLVPIPERDSLVQVPLSPQLEEIPFDNSLVPENLSIIPLPVAAEMSFPENPLSTVAPDIEMTTVQPETFGAVTSMDNAGISVALNELITQADKCPQNAEVSQQQQPHEDDVAHSWFEILRPREDIPYPRVIGQRRKRKKRQRGVDVQDGSPRRVPELPDSTERSAFPNVPDNFSTQITQQPIESCFDENESELLCYFDLIKDAGKNADYRTWRCFDPHLFNESDSFEVYTSIYKRIIQDDFIEMDALHKEGTTRLEAARGFRLILELKTMGLIEIYAIDTRIKGFKFKASDVIDS